MTIAVRTSAWTSGSVVAGSSSPPWPERIGTHDLVPILSGHGGEEVPATADPLVQALVLTAIVISFGMTAFALVLSYRAYQENGTMNVREFAQ